MSDKNVNIDDLFRDAFENFEVDPPEHVWKNIQKNMPGNGGGSGKSFPKGGILGISVILILSSLFFIYQLNDSVSATYASEKIALNSDVENIESLLSIADLNSEDQKNESLSKKDNLSEKGLIAVYSSSTEAEILSKRGNDAMIVKEKPATKIIVEANNSRVTRDETNFILSNDAEVQKELPDDSDLLALSGGNSIRSNVMASAPIPQEAFETMPLMEMTEKEDASSESGDIAGPEIKSDYGKRGDLYFGLYFTPEVIFYPSDLNKMNKSYSLDLNVIYKFSNYLLQSGVGVMSSSDDGQYKVDFEKFLGSYEDVYDVTFDTTANGVVPVYHTETVNVYDSIQHVTVTPTKNKYTYLQIPILFGYTEEFRRFSWFVKGGPSLSLMVNENLSSVNLDNDNNRIINVDSEVPSRIKANWQIVLSGGITYKLGNHVSLGVEPMVRFYMKSAYEQNTVQTKHPYSFGIRSGIIVNF